MLELIDKVGFGLMQGLSRVMDVCLKSYFDIVRCHLTLQKLAQRAKAPKSFMWVKQIVKATGAKRVPQEKFSD